MLIQKRHIRSIKALSLMMMYVLIIACSTLFMHRHMLSSGRAVIHIHPYSASSNPSDNNNHESETEIITLDITYFQSYFNPSIHLIGDPLERALKAVFNEPILRRVQVDSQLCFSLRGPPQYTFS